MWIELVDVFLGVKGTDRYLFFYFIILIFFRSLRSFCSLCGLYSLYSLRIFSSFVDLLLHFLGPLILLVLDVVALFHQVATEDGHLDRLMLGLNLHLLTSVLIRSVAVAAILIIVLVLVLYRVLEAVYGPLSLIFSWKWLMVLIWAGWLPLRFAALVRILFLFLFLVILVDIQVD